MICLLASALFIQGSTNHLTLKIGTGNDDFRDGSKLDVTVVTRTGRLAPIEIARGARFPDRSTQTIEVDLPRTINIEDIEQVELRYYNRHRDFMEDDKWRFESIQITARTTTRTQSLYANTALATFFQSDSTWSTGVLSTFRRASGKLFQVNDEAGRPAAAADIFLNNNFLGKTDSTGQFSTSEAIDSNSQIVVRHRVHEQNYYRSHHSQDSTQNWNYRIYKTNVRIGNDARAQGLFTVVGDRVNVQVRNNQCMYGLNLVFSNEMDTSPVDNSRWTQVAKNMSQFLYNATDGQFFVERVTFMDNGQHWDDSDGRFHSPGGSFRDGYYPYRAHVPNQPGGFLGQNILGTCMNLSRTSDFYTISHEFGHYGLDVRDEYSDSDDNLKCTPALDMTGAFSGGSPQSSCMMWSQWGAPKLCSSRADNPHRDGTRQGSTACWDHLFDRWNHPGLGNLMKPNGRSAILGTITWGGTPVALNYMMPTVTFEDITRPGLIPEAYLTVVGPSGAQEPFSRLTLHLSTGESQDIGVSNGIGDILIEGAHGGESITAVSEDGLRTGSITLGRNIPSTLVLSGGSAEEEEFVQVRPGKGGGSIKNPTDGTFLPLFPKATITADGFTVSVQNSSDIQSITSVVLQPEGRKPLVQGKIQKPTVEGYNADFAKVETVSGTIFVRGTAKNGQKAFGFCPIVIAKTSGDPDQDIFGPYGAINIHGLGKGTRSSRILIAEVPLHNIDPAIRPVGFGYQILSDHPDILSKGKIEFRVPLTKNIKLKNFSVNAIDLDRKTKSLGKQIQHGSLGLAISPLTGAGTYFAKD